MMGQAAILPSHAQLISRVYNCDAQEEPIATEWWPGVEPDMTMLNIHDSRALMYYVLHAKHKKLDDDQLTFMNQLGEDFQILVDLAELES